MKFFIFLIIFSLNLHSQDRAVSLDYLSKKQIQALNLIELKLSALEMQAEFRKTPESILKLIPYYEKLVEFYCMPNIHKNLSHQKIDNSEKCLSNYNNLVKIQADNPVGICAKKGLKSVECIYAYERQYINTYAFDKEIVGELDLELKLGDKYPNKILTDLNFRLKRYLFNYSKNPSYQLKKEIENIYLKFITHHCSKTKIAITKTAPNLTLRKDYKKIKYKDELSKLIDQYEKDVIFKEKKYKDFEETYPNKYNIYRIRNISNNCSTSIKNSLLFNPEFPTAYCYREGFSSPACLIAKNNEKTNP